MKNYINPTIDVIKFSAKEILADEINFSIGCCDGLNPVFTDECEGEVE